MLEKLFKLFLKKKILILLAVITTLFALIVITLFSEKPDSGREVESPKITTIITKTEEKEEKNLQQEYSGADFVGNKQFFDSNPQLKIEAEIQSNLPFYGNGFTIDYNYQRDKFLAKIHKPYIENEDNFRRWLDDVHLTGTNRFLLLHD